MQQQPRPLSPFLLHLLLQVVHDDNEPEDDIDNDDDDEHQHHNNDNDCDDNEYDRDSDDSPLSPSSEKTQACFSWKLSLPSPGGIAPLSLSSLLSSLLLSLYHYYHCYHYHFCYHCGMKVVVSSSPLPSPPNNPRLRRPSPTPDLPPLATGGNARPAGGTSLPKTKNYIPRSGPSPAPAPGDIITELKMQVMH